MHRQHNAGSAVSMYTRIPLTGTLAMVVLTILCASSAPVHAQDMPRSCPSAAAIRDGEHAGTRASEADSGMRASMASADMAPAAARTEVDSARSLIRVIAGPYHIAPGTMHHLHDASMDATVLRFVWPVNGWLRGYQVLLCDADAQGTEPMSRQMLHHAGLANFSRRQLVYPMVERLLAVGSETDNVLLPPGVGVPVQRGDTLGIYAGLHGSNGAGANRAYLIVTMPWTRPRRHGPIQVLPFYVDVNNVIGGTTAFDLPPGPTVRSAVFVLPIGGRLLGIGGHMHDYGVALRLEDAQNGKVLGRLRANREADGRIRGVSRFNYGFHEEALHLEGGHRYRIVAEYDNPTGRTLEHGGMGSIAGAFAPDDISEWPALNRIDPDVQRDEASLARGDMSMP